MAWWRRKQSTPVAKVKAGMTEEQVEGLLGRPQQTATEQEFQDDRPMVGEGGRRMKDNVYWYYEDLPRQGMTTMITFRKGRVLSVMDGLS